MYENEVFAKQNIKNLRVIIANGFDKIEEDLKRLNVQIVQEKYYPRVKK